MTPDPPCAWPRPLTPGDLMFLRLEKPEWPCHYGVLLEVDARPLLDPGGVLPLDQVSDEIARRMAGVPQFRQRLQVPGRFRGEPSWVDDPHFDPRAHLRRRQVPAPGRQGDLVAAALDAYGPRLNRERPLWEIWLLTGLPDGRLGILLKLHHTVADGLAALDLTAALTDPTAAPDPAPRQPLCPTPPGPAGREPDPRDARRPGGRSLLRTVRGFLGRGGDGGSALNAVVGNGRRIGRLSLDLAAVKEVAHRHGGTANDVALTLFAGGARALLAARDVPLAGVEIATGQTVTLRSPEGANRAGNQVGSVLVHLPAWEADVSRRLHLVVDRTGRAKAAQRPASIMSILAALAATPLGRFYTAHQRAANAISTNVRGPDTPRKLLGAPILSVLPIIELVGNIALTQTAYSHAGRFDLVVTADAAAFDDLPVLVEAMERDWRALASAAAGPEGLGYRP